MTSNAVHFLGGSHLAKGETLTEFAQFTEKTGFDGMSVADHVAGGPQGFWDPLLAMGWIAAVTERLEVLSCVLVLPLTHPVRVARQAADLDILSKGRGILAVGVGGEDVKEFEAGGVPVHERGARTNEYIEVIMGLWTQEKFTYDGRWFQYKDITFVPKPSSKPHPRLWVGGRLGGVEIGPDGQKRFKSRTAAVRRAAKYADGWFPNHMTPEQFKESIDMLNTFKKEYGRENVPFTHCQNTSVVLTDSVEESLAEVAGKIRYGETRNDSFALKYDILGSPKDCIKRIREYVDVGVTYFNCGFGSKDRRARMERFAKEVIPYFK